MTPLANVSAPYDMVVWRDAQGKARPCRRVWMGASKAAFVLFDTDQEDGLQQTFLVPEEGSAYGNLEPAAERCTPRMQSYRQWALQVAVRIKLGELSSEADDPWPAPQTDGERAAMACKWRWIAPLFEGKSTIFGQPAARFFQDASWRQTVFRRIAEVHQVDTRDVKLAYFLCVRYGGGKAALLSLRHEKSGGKGQAKLASPGRARSGAPQPDNVLYARHPVARQAWDAQMEGNLTALVRDLIRSCWDEPSRGIHVKAVLDKRCKSTAVWEAYTHRYFLKDQSEAEKNNRPSKAMVTTHLEQMIQRDLATWVLEIEREERIKRGLPAERPVREPHVPIEAPADIGAGIFETVQLDCKIFTRFMIYKIDPKTGQPVDINPPRVILARGDHPDILLGWHVTAFPEKGQAYRFCLYNLFSDKRSRLRQLGMKLEDYPGLVQGYAHLAVFDRGPARGKQVGLLAPGAVDLATALTLPGTPTHKGGVERANGRVAAAIDQAVGLTKEAFDEVESAVDGLPAGTYTFDRLIRRLAKRKEKTEGGGYIRVTLRTFERLLVLIIDKLNRQRPQHIRAFSHADILAEGTGTRAELYGSKFARLIELDGWDRIGAQAQRMRMLELKPRTVKSLTVEFDRRSFGAYAGESYEGACQLARYLAGWNERKRLGQLDPAEVSKNGKPRIAVTLPPYDSGLQWLPIGEAAEWVELRETLTSRGTFGDNSDCDDAVATRRVYNRSRARGERADPVAVDETAVHDVHRDNRVARDGQSWKASADARERTSQAQANEEARDHDREVGQGAAMPTSGQDGSQRLSAKVPLGTPADQAATAQILKKILEGTPAKKPDA